MLNKKFRLLFEGVLRSTIKFILKFTILSFIIKVTKLEGINANPIEIKKTNELSLPEDVLNFCLYVNGSGL